jgi:hypothetical protein
MKESKINSSLIYHLFMAILMTVCISCSDDEASHSVTTPLSAFKQVECHSAFNVFLKEDTAFSIQAIGNQDVVEQLVFAVSDSVLKIEDPRKSEWRTPTSNKVELYITSPPLSKLSTFEACKISTLNPITSDEFGLVLGGKANEATLQLDCDIFYHWSGSISGGKITLEGNCSTLKLWNTGLVQIDAFNLQANYAFVENKSRGNCEVKVSTKIDYSIFNTGDIIVYGEPQEINELTNNEDALGQLIKK